MENRIYTINELMSLITESANEVKAKIGDGVQSSNKKENSKTYKETAKKVKNFDGGGEEDKHERKVYDKLDGNKTTLDYTTEGPVGSDFAEKVKAQAEGYTSTLEKKNGIEKNADFNDKTYQQFKKAGEEMQKNVEDKKKTGLTASKMPKDTFKKDNLYEGEKLTLIKFNKTTFLNEEQMLSRIPSDFKVEGKKIKVKDAGENEFIVEWKEGEANILSHENKKKLNESISKFQKLSGYKSKDYFKKSNNQTRLDESDKFNNILNITRVLTNKEE